MVVSVNTEQPHLQRVVRRARPQANPTLSKMKRLHATMHSIGEMRASALLNRPRALVGLKSWRPHYPVRVSAAQQRKPLFATSTDPRPPSSQLPLSPRLEPNPALVLNPEATSDAQATTDAQTAVIWQRMRQLQEEEIEVIVKVERANSGGLVVRYEPFERSGFLPRSQLGFDIQSVVMDSLVGLSLAVKFKEVNLDKQRIIFSNKLASSVSERTKAAMQAIKPGRLVTGVVHSTRRYGAFLDLGDGVEGLLHVSQISNSHVANVDAVLKKGDKLKMLVSSVDVERGRITLSTKKLEPTPGDMLRDPQLVFDKAEEMTEIYRKRIEDCEKEVNRALVADHGKKVSSALKA